MGHAGDEVDLRFRQPLGALRGDENHPHAYAQQ